MPMFSINQVEEGIDYAQQALDVAEGNIMKSRCSLTLGVGYSLKAEGAKLQVVRQEYQRKALNLFFRSQGLDKNDHLAKFHVALQLAILRQVSAGCSRIGSRVYNKCKSIREESIQISLYFKFSFVS